jgi:hypothetical protein
MSGIQKGKQEFFKKMDKKKKLVERSFEHKLIFIRRISSADDFLMTSVSAVKAKVKYF